MSAIPYSVLDLVPVAEGSQPAESFRRSLDLARHAERWGYNRYWLAEHHNMPGIASAATSVLIGHLAGGTNTLRIGAGGIMLPNHSPLVIAEQFGTLASLYPDRIDLGLGRAPGTDQRTMRALRRQRSGEMDDFPADVRELMDYFGDEVGAVQAVPGQGLHLPIWLLGSSLYSAQLAAAMGLPFGFASHFAPAMLLQALEIYRAQYRPSARWPKPHAVVCINMIAADSEREARFQFTTLQQQFLRLHRGNAGKLPAPVVELSEEWSERELVAMEQTLARSLVGNPDQVHHGLKALLAETRADELMFNGPIVDHQARLRSFEIAAELMQAL
ncbi:luciferase-like monooxygenase [Aeromonas dhakensis]|uniref:luciferase-like monooxygenase n=1 Tax=Aeromonas dhakensis TaxID=196024 RepID=UPI0019817B5D|nr:luciferase-like monooxygenase [Aeromonas dhakensis]MBW3732578.1 luciferase-like monooxygenase [Aeromonas dhakensis]QSR57138.1 luciferase-like monooxygenase [Aeromonas dhakensis]